MDEEWLQLRDFPTYSVSSHGRVRNDETDRILARTLNQRGLMQVGLMKGGIYYKRGLALMVSNAHLPKPKQKSLDTPINLDGDRTNCYVENLAWRPRWFAYAYHAQFKRTQTNGIKVPVINTNTSERFDTALQACQQYGLLESELILAMSNRTYVMPTYHIYKFVE